MHIETRDKSDVMVTNVTRQYSTQVRDSRGGGEPGFAGTVVALVMPDIRVPNKVDACSDKDSEVTPSCDGSEADKGREFARISDDEAVWGLEKGGSGRIRSWMLAIVSIDGAERPRRTDEQTSKITIEHMTQKIRVRRPAALTARTPNRDRLTTPSNTTRLESVVERPPIWSIRPWSLRSGAATDGKLHCMRVR